MTLPPAEPGSGASAPASPQTGPQSHPSETTPAFAPLPPVPPAPAPRRSRTRLSPAERRSQLLNLGVSWLSHRPLEAITVEDLAAHAQVSPGLVFYYFESRQGLHVAILRKASKALLRSFAPSLDVPAAERTHDAVARLVAFVRENGETFASIARSATSPDEEIRAINQRVRESTAEYTRAMLDELGVPDTLIVALAIRAWLVVVEQALLEAVSADGPGLDDQQLVEFLTRTLFAMITADA